MAPIVYSLNRGLWIGLGVMVLYVAVRLAVRGRSVEVSRPPAPRPTNGGPR